MGVFICKRDCSHGLAVCVRHRHPLKNHEFKFQISNNNPVTRSEYGFLADPLAIDKSSVGAPQISQTYGEIVNTEYTVVTTYHIAIRAKLAILFTTDQKLPAIQGNDLTGMFSTGNFQFRCDHNWETPKE